MYISGQDPSKPKRAMSAFFLYSQGNRQRVKEENPEAPFGEIVSPHCLILTWLFALCCVFSVCDYLLCYLENGCGSCIIDLCVVFCDCIHCEHHICRGKLLYKYSITIAHRQPPWSIATGKASRKARYEAKTTHFSKIVCPLYNSVQFLRLLFLHFQCRKLQKCPFVRTMSETFVQCERALFIAISYKNLSHS